MKGKFKKFLAASALALLCALRCVAASAADGDVPLAAAYEDESGSRVALPEGAFVRSGALWAPLDALRLMGAPAALGENKKSAVIKVENPADAFDIPALAQLAGGALSLDFPLIRVGEAYFFNMTGMQNLVKLDYRIESGSVIFTPNASAKAYLRGGAAKPEPKDGKLTLVWEHVAAENPDLGAQAPIPGLDVISPTWFNLKDAGGGMANRASFAYVEAAHRRGYLVWALVSNSFNAQMSSSFFRNARAMNLFIARLLIYAKLYGLDGVNLDFEGLDEADRANFVGFVSRLSEFLRAEGLTFSVDVFIPANTKSSRSHDRAALAKYADYIMLMAYDEHWRTCKVAGSVASLPWVARAVEGALAEGVPAEKLVLGVPFYMRRWEETRGPGGVSVKGYTLTMAGAEEILARRGLTMQWLPSAGQNYFAYSADGKVQKIWVEDAASIAKKLELVQKHGLAGIAAWRKGHEKPQVWDVISEMMGK
ncbi:glycosyl hydrolase family 18 protein [Synergistes jonesii]|uniref:glycosyl hydrolase family 18 protein n=1 Tax=Synergistes jonesii TaxID=2754 RepID=UPI00248F07D0|nr:glycosyl hydrolase family 18 protein [Synergistes jonesii]